MASRPRHDERDEDEGGTTSEHNSHKPPTMGGAIDGRVRCHLRITWGGLWRLAHPLMVGRCRLAAGNGSSLSGVGSALTVRATWNETVIAESDRTILVEGNQYFPEDDVATELLEPSTTHTFCPWKGEASYFSVVVDGARNEDAAWFYSEPYEAAAPIRNFVAFWRGVEVTGANNDTQEIRPPGR